jgi:formylglycine-generating enzyme required for sulfatase activity
MARLRHVLISIGVTVCLIGCGRSAQAPEPSSSGKKSTENPKPAPVAKVLRVAPEWHSKVPEITAAQVAQTLRQAKDALGRGQLERGSSPGPGALELYLAVLEVDADNREAQTGVQSALDALLERGRLAMREGKLGDAERIELIARSLLAEHPDLPVFRKHLQAAHQAELLVAKANAAGSSGRFTQPAGSSALDYFRLARHVFSDFAPIDAGIDHWNKALLQRAWTSASADDFSAADGYLLESAKLMPLSVDARVASLRIVELRQERTEAVLAQGNAEVDKLQLDKADATLLQLRKVAAQKGVIETLRERIHLARHYGPFKPGQYFSEKLSGGGVAPEMVVIPFGSFVMGSSDSDPGHQDNEAPAHEVAFERGFAMARNEITVAEFKRFIDSSHYRTAATRAGHSVVYDEKGGVFSEHEGVDWRRDHVGRIASPALPVVHISVQDAIAYSNWLSLQTKRRYRLPSEAEFEYVLRARSTTAYPWGDEPPKRIVGNLPGDGDLSRLGRNWGNAIPGYRDAFWGPAPVRNFPAERFGTFDIIGNVSEWTLDCWHDSYQRAPLDGSAWVNPGCPQRVVRGASWGSSLDQARSASRLPMDAASSTARLGFRVVREL